MTLASRSGRRAILAGAALAAVFIVAQGCAAHQSGPLTGRSVADLTLTGVDGHPVQLRNLVHGDIALVDFWASWCAPCLEAMPHLDELYKRYAGRGFTVVGVMVDDNATRIGPEFIRKKNLSYPNVLDDAAAASEKAIGPVSGIPLLLLVDRQGKIVNVFEGYADPEEIEHAVSALLGGATPPAGAPAAS